MRAILANETSFSPFALQTWLKGLCFDITLSLRQATKRAMKEYELRLQIGKVRANRPLYRDYAK
jgi:hypothetical protein